MIDYNKNLLFVGSGTAEEADAVSELELDIATDTDAVTTEVVVPDDRLYLSRSYAGKTIDDCYSMLVSVRNSILLLCMIIFLFEAHKILKNAFKRHYKS